MIDILEIKPHQVSADLKGYVVGIYGAPGIGKTQTALQASKPLLLACEAGYKALAGTMAADINSWTDVLTVASQLKKPEVIEKFDTIIIDTLDELVFYAEQFVLASKGVSDLTDIPWGAGYTQLATMFRKLFKDITRHYGLIIIAHADLKIDNDDPEKIKYATLGINKKVKKIVVGLLDILAYVESDRKTPGVSIVHYKPAVGWDAKARFPKIVEGNIFSYDNLAKDIQNAVSGEATISKTKDYGSDAEIFSQKEYDSLKEQANIKATEKINIVGLQTVLELINSTLSCKISETNIGHTAALRVLLEELDRL